MNITAVLLAASLSLPTLSILASQPEKLAAKQVLRVGNSAEPKTLDPAKATGMFEIHVLDSLFEGLVSFDAKTYKIVPGVASSWTVSKDNLVYTFELRPDAQWSDGTPLTAEDFVASWRRALDPELASEYAYQLYYIKNGKPFNEGKVKDPNQLGIKAAGPHRLVVTLEHPCPFFLDLAGFQTLFPVPMHIVKNYPKMSEQWTQNDMVSNGPFRMSERRLNQHIKLVKNERYWDKKSVNLEEIFIYPTENADTEEKTFISGKLDITATVPTLRIPVYAAKAKHDPASSTFRNNPVFATYFYRFNTKRKPTDDVRVRRALAMVIDRKEIVENVLRGGQMTATNLVPPGTAGYTYGSGPFKDHVTPEVIADAKKLLAEAGYPDGKGMAPVEILYNTRDDYKKTAVAIQQMWKKALGIEAKLFNQEWKVYLDNQSKMNYTTLQARWIGDYMDANTYLGMFITNGTDNFTGWGNPRYDQLIKEAGMTVDAPKRIAMFKEAEKILLDEMPIAPLYFGTTQRLVSPKLRVASSDGTLGPWASNLMDRWFFKYYALAE